MLLCLRSDIATFTCSGCMLNRRGLTMSPSGLQVYNYTGETGTYRYMAPEVYRHEPYNGKADVYRCVCLIQQCLQLSGRPLSVPLDIGKKRAV